MADITAKDIEAFGRVLKAIGHLCEENPKRVIQLLHKIDTADPPEVQDSSEPPQSGDSRFADLEKLNIFEFAKGKSRDDLMTFFQKFDVEQLRYLTRRNRFGAVKTKSSQVLVEHLVDQVMKRLVDVFKTHE